MKNEKEIKQKIEDLKNVLTSMFTENEIKKKEKIDILEWVLTDEPKFKIGDKVVYKNNGCEFLGEIVGTNQINNKFYLVEFDKCVIDALNIHEDNLVKLIYERLYNFKNN